jgi:hypothetical protein
VPGIDDVELIEHLAACGANRICDGDELSRFADMEFEIVQQLLWYVETHLGHAYSYRLMHIKVFVGEYCSIMRGIRPDLLC